VAMLAQYDMRSSANSCYHFHIADAQGGSAVVEYIGSEMNVVQSRAATNFLLTPGDYPFGKGQDRYAVLQAKLTENGGVFADTAEAMALLKAVSQDKISEETGVYTGTQWSCVYDQSAVGVSIVIGRDYDTVLTLSLAD
ncbi:MAG: linear amide C-N hydrolase, partial [Clostridia bacterium]|nr:linear amide C-N hydrolase [Clostridia bacterium]